MTPAARLQAAIECLDLVAAAAREGGAAGDTVVQRYFAARRYAGSKDRRAVRELLFAAVRALGEAPSTGRAGMIGYARAVQPELLALFDGSPHGPAPLSGDEPAASPDLVPGWLGDRLAARFGDSWCAEAEALLGRAPLDLRVVGDRLAVAAMLPPEAQAGPTPLSPLGLRCLPFAVEATEAFRAGRFEVQDEGSQLVALACEPREGETVIDLCAGAGGKTLALAALASGARLVACDTDRGRLSGLSPRASRAGISVETRLLDPGREMERLGDLAGAADLVLVDAPCSGTGTWRRNPEARWRLTPDRLARLTALQAHVLDLAAGLVRPGGRLIYAVCSVLAEEGDAQADAFLARSGWQAHAFEAAPALGRTGRLRLTPASTGCDGFFVAGFARPR